VGVAFGITGAAAFAQADFSADIVSLSADRNTFHSKVFSSQERLRFQGEDRSGRINSILIANPATRTSIVLIPQQHEYVESKVPQIAGQGVTFFRPADVEDACDDWKRITHTEKGKCRKVGHEQVNGRDTVRYEVAPGQGSAAPMWIDVKLHFPVKWQNAVGAGELRNIQEAAQPAELFEVPAGYSKRTPGGPKAQPPKP